MDKNLTKNIEIIGEWFLPDSDNKIPGVFRYKDGQSTLELLRPFTVEKRTTQDSTFKTIHGQTKNGPVTLTHVIFNFLYAHGSVYSAIFGRLLDDNHTLEGIGFNFDLLNEWATSKHPYKVKQDDFYADTLEKYAFTIDDVTCELLISLGTSAGYLKGTRTYNLSNFLLKAEKGKSFHALFDYVIGIQYFLMLVMGRSLNLDSMTNLSNNSLSKDIFLPVSKKETKGSDLDHFFNISFIRKNYTSVLTNWFDFYLKNKYLLKMFFGTMHDNTVKSSDFFVYASLLEGYYKSKYTEESEYKKRIRVVLQPLSHDFSNLDEFINVIEKMRHDNFHFNKRDELDEDLLQKVTHDLFFIIRIILLNHIGVSITINSIPHMKDLMFLKRIK